MEKADRFDLIWFGEAKLLRFGGANPHRGAERFGFANAKEAKSMQNTALIESRGHSSASCASRYVVLIAYPSSSLTDTDWLHRKHVCSTVRKNYS
jgi:hypothetical protein